MESKFRESTITTLNLIADEQLAFTDSNRNRIINNIKKIIVSLRNKNIINLKCDDKINASSSIHVSFPFLGMGYEHFYQDLWNKIESPEELFIYFMIQRFEDFGGFEKSKEEWSNLLGYNSKTTGCNIISKMESEGKIYSVQGEKYIDNQGRIKQHSTKWHIGSRPETTIQNHNIPDSPVPFDINEEHFNNKEGVISFGNWKGGSNLTDDDYILYAEQIDNDQFIKIADSKIDRITKNRTNEKAMFKIESEIEEAKTIVEVKKKEEMKKLDELHNNELLEKNKDKFVLRDRDGQCIVVDEYTFSEMNLSQFGDKYGNHGKFIFGDNEYEPSEIFGYSSFETKIIVYEKMLELVKEQNTLFESDINTLYKLRTEIVNRNNMGREINEEWEGDIVDYNEGNISLKERMKNSKN
ncbi:hypothetical protein C171_23730 [Paenibacillus sp. FSL H8-237]|uniref:hypothetical protein n=1 Tax=Paenibacillus TaxID=44249 RepID=UPI0003E2313A|nr:MULTISPECIES: hypothetical protein [Paenibacillus]ETT49337.1 hypothetical protein C171_23730 [Paenibacillus sp. FSL H8-237]